jgi:hypothetical protein
MNFQVVFTCESGAEVIVWADNGGWEMPSDMFSLLSHVETRERGRLDLVLVIILAQDTTLLLAAMHEEVIL